MIRKGPSMTAAVLALGVSGTLFTLSVSGDIPGVWGLAALAALPLSGLFLATWATEARRS
jgi:hypothetical protein